MTLLSTLVPALKRELAVPGDFDTIFPNTGDDDLTDSLADGFAEAQLWGFFPTMTLIPVGDDWDTTEALSLPGASLIIYFAASRIIRSQLRNMLSVERYKAGPAEVEFQRAASVLKDELDYLTTRIATLIEGHTAASRPLTTVHDNYLARGMGLVPLSSSNYWYPWELGA